MDEEETAWKKREEKKTEKLNLLTFYFRINTG